MNKYLRNKKPQRKPDHDLHVRLYKDKELTYKGKIEFRLWDKKKLKGKLQKIARKNQISLNKLLIYILDWFIYSYEEGKEFKIDLK